MRQKAEKSTNSKKNKKDIQKLKVKLEDLSNESKKIPYYIENLQEYKKEDIEATIEQILEFDKQRAEERKLDVR